MSHGEAFTRNQPAAALSQAGLPDADLRQIDRHGIGPVRLEDTSHYRLYREFILYPHETIEAMTE